MKEFGADEARVERFREENYEPEDAEDFYVYPVNSDAVRVFLRCRWQRLTVPNMTGAVVLYEGIDAQEVQTVAQMLGIPQERFETVLAGVRCMQNFALPRLNK